MQEQKLPISLQNNNPLVSIVLPCYNGEEFLARSIESCLNQTYRNIELILVNDCSTDGTHEIMAHYASQDPRVTVITNEKNSHIAASLNNGFAHAKGEYFTWTSDDNFYALNAIAYMLHELIRTNSDIVYAKMNMVDKLGNCLCKMELQEDYRNLFYTNPIGACFLYRQEVDRKNGGYNTAWPLVEDYHFWLTTWKNNFAFYHIDTILYSYTFHAKSLTATKQDAIQRAHFELIWQFRTLAEKASPQALKEFCLRIQTDSKKFKKLRGHANFFCLRYCPQIYLVLAQPYKLVACTFLRKIFWNWLPSKFREQIKVFLGIKNRT